MSSNKNFASLIDLIFKNPKSCILLAIAIVLSMSVGVLNLESDFSAKYWFKQTDKEVKTLDFSNKIFPRGDDLILILSKKDKSPISNKDNLHKLNDITESLLNLPYFQKVKSLTNQIEVRKEGFEEIEINKIYADSDPIRLFTKIKTDQNLKSLFLSKKNTSTLIFLELKKEYTIDHLSIIKTKVKNIVANDWKIQFSGFSILLESFKEVSKSDLLKIIPTIGIVFTLVLYLKFGNILFAVFPQLIFSLATISVFGCSGFLNLKFHNISTVIPGIIITIAMADVLHILTTYSQRRNNSIQHELALKQSALKNFMPTLITSVTTAAGFLSFIGADLAPITQIGVLAGLGTLLVWLLTYLLFIPSILIMAPSKPKTKLNWNMNFERPYIWCSQNKFKFLSLIIITTFTFSYLTFKNSFNTNPYTYFSESTEITKATTSIKKDFGFNGGPELLLETNGNLRKKSYFKRLVDFENELKSSTEIKWVKSPINLIHETSIALVEKPIDINISDTISFLSLFGDNENNIYEAMSADEKYISIKVGWNIEDSKSFLAKIEEIKKLAVKYDLNIKPTGNLLLYHQMIDSVVQTLIISTLTAVWVIFLILWAIFKNFKIAIFSLIPNIFPLLFTFSVAYIFGISIDLTIALIAAVSLGLAVDDTIHIFSHYKQELQKNNNIELATTNVLSQTGAALVTTTLVLSLGFSSFIIGDFVANGYFGILCGMAFIIALLMDLTLLPLILNYSLNNQNQVKEPE